MKGTFLRYHRPGVLNVLVGRLPSHAKPTFRVAYNLILSAWGPK